MKHQIETDTLKWKEGKVKNFFGKELLNLPHGTLKLMKVAPLSSYPLHQHPKHTEYAYVLEGKPHIVIGNEETDARPGDFFIFPKDTQHAISNPTSVFCRMLVGAIAE